MKLRDGNGKIKKSVIIGGTAVAIFGIWGIYKLCTRKKSENGDILEDTLKELDTAKTTITQAQARDIANKLYNAMKDVGTDTNAINALIVAPALTSEDLKMIVAAFGIKPYGSFGEPMFSWLNSTDLDLIGWLKEECSGDLLEKVMMKFGQAGFIVS